MPGPSLAELDVVDAAELVRHLGTGSYRTLHDRAIRGELLAFDVDGARRFALGRFDEAGNVLTGALAVIKELGSRLTTWQWLQTPSPPLDDVAPIERLHRGDCSAAGNFLDAARAERHGDVA